MIRVTELPGLGSIPNDRSAAWSSLQTRKIAPVSDGRDGRRPASESISDLPAPERLAYLRRELDSAGIDQGAWDEEAHAPYLAAKPKARKEAERRAAMVRLIRSLPGDTTWADRSRLVRETFGAKGTDKRTLRRQLETASKVDPINWAPALLPGYAGSTTQAVMSEDAWRFFLTSIQKAAPEWPLRQAWRNTRDVAQGAGWNWPSFATVYRRCNALPTSQQWVARHGRDETAKRLTQPALRDKTTIRPLDWVSLDGRTQDVWAHDGDGRAYRPTMLALMDVASNMVSAGR